MQYSDFKEKKISKLGFGTMRLPQKDGSIDFELTEKMIDTAVRAGINYFDTAWPYHAGNSEIVTGKILSKYPRDSYYLADKYPGHQYADSYDPAGVFEKQLEKCGVEYFDFYLLHNVCESSYDVYTDPKWNIVEYFVSERRRGRIKHLGFSTHARPETLELFLEKYADVMEFCQIQYNYVDETLQDAKKKCEILDRYSIPIWVMEPLRGGKLSNLDSDISAKLREARPHDSDSAWAFRWLLSKENVVTILSGMSDMDQLEENIKTFSDEDRMTKAEAALLESTAGALHTTVPCTACRYCVDKCPMGLDIPLLISGYNDAKYQSAFTVPMLLESLPDNKLPTACIGCASCERMCPQNIEISKIMKDFALLMPTMKSWKKLCIERAAQTKALEEKE